MNVLNDLRASIDDEVKRLRKAHDEDEDFAATRLGKLH